MGSTTSSILLPRRRPGNGTAAMATPIASGVVFTAGELVAGTDYVTWCVGLYDIDEFVMMVRAATAASNGLAVRVGRTSL